MLGDNGMIKDKVFQIEDGTSFYIIDDINYQNRKYALTLQCDLDKDEVNEDEYLVMEVTMDNGGLQLKGIYDDELAAIVTKMLIDKVRSN